MNKKVLKTMICLVIAFLFGIYILKFFMPEQFVMAIQNENLIKIGNFIDNNKFASCIYGIIIGFIFDYFYFGAVCKQTKLNWKLLIIIIIYNIGFSIFYNFAPMNLITNFSLTITAISSCYMILVPMLFTKELKPLSITYCVNYIAQTFSLQIRGISLLMTNANSIIMTLMSFECYLWVILLFAYFNYKKEI